MSPWALDAGAHGVLVPYCETVEEVKEVIAAARWRPLKGALVDRVMETGGNSQARYRKSIYRKEIATRLS